MENLYGDEIENKYSQETDIQYRRSLGQFFTPFKIACFMSDWVLANPKETLNILDPASGFGVFERALKYRAPKRHLSFDLWEIDQGISNSLREIIDQGSIIANIFNNDFLSSPWDNKYDGIIANPPYYKHHHIGDKNSLYSDICCKTIFRFSIQTNIYCWFLIKCINQLSSGGKLSFIVPSEFMNANYGEKIKEYLLAAGVILHLINIHFVETVFDNAITTSVIILAEKSNDKSRIINFYNVTDIADMNELFEFINNHPKVVRNVSKLNPKIKWHNYFNGYEDSDINNKLIPFTNIGRFSRGIATGSNEYFTLTENEAADYKIPKECLLPCVTKANQVKDIYFSEDDFEYLRKSDKNIYLFNGECSNNQYVLNYIRKGEEDKIDQRFLTKNRSPWYALEKRDVSDIWVGVFGRKGIKFILNDSNCLTLTCFHVFYPTTMGRKYLDIFFLYLNTAFAKDLFNKEKREYGDGLEKFEPNDINKAYIFNFAKLSDGELKTLRVLQRKFIHGDKLKRPEILMSANNIFKKAVESTPSEGLFQG